MAARARAGKPKDEDDEVVTPEDFELVKFIEESGGTIAQVFIYRVSPKGILEHVDTTTVEGMSEEVLRANYGAPATYSLRFKGSDGRFKAEKRIHLGPVRVGGEERSGVPGSSTTEALMKMQLDLMTQRMAEQTQMVNTLLASLVQRPQPTAPDPAAMLTALVSAFSVLQGAAKATAPPDPLTQIKSVAELITSLGAGGTPDSKEDNVWSVVREVGSRAVEMARPLIEGATRQVVNAPGPTPQAVHTPAAQLPATTNGESQVKLIQDYIRDGLAYLKKKADSGKDAELFVDFVLENGEEPQNAALIGAIQQGATFEQLLQFDSEIANNPVRVTWFRILYDGIHAELFDSGDTPVDSKRAGGNAGDASGNGGASAAGSGSTVAPVA